MNDVREQVADELRPHELVDEGLSLPGENDPLVEQGVDARREIRSE